jgi:amidophosphoribosyltransferase
LIAGGAICQSTSDTEVVLHLIARSRYTSTDRPLHRRDPQMEGGYSMVGDDPHQADRRPRPQRHPAAGAWANSTASRSSASETCALDIIGAKYIRDVENGESSICEVQPDGSITIDSAKPFGQSAAGTPLPVRICLFRPSGLVVGGRSVYVARKRMGINLAKEAPVEADVVVPVPDSGVPAAMGYASEAGIPFELGIIRNHYVGRTFIEPTDQIRHLGVKLKHSANKPMLEGKRVILVDDSIVRGTTSRKIVEMVREAGAKEVHMRVASPMIFYPTSTASTRRIRDKLLANQYP